MAKNIDRTKLEWLLAELAELRGQGVIDGDAEQRIRGYYAASEAGPASQDAAAAARAGWPDSAEKARAAVKSGKQQYFLAVLVSLGALMVGCGVILLFAHNWDMLSKFQRVAVAFVPVIIGACCGVYTLAKKKDQRWREASAFFTAVGFAVLTALISQIYHTGGTLREFLLLVMAVSLPLVYIFRAYLLTAVYCVLLLVLVDFHLAEWTGGGFFHFAGIAPFVAYYLFFHKPAGLRTVWMRYICLMPLAYLLIFFRVNDALRLHLFAAAGLLYTAGLRYNETGVRGWRNPWAACGWLFLTVLLVITSVSPYFLKLRYLYGLEKVPLGYYLSGLWLALFAAQVFAASRRITPLKVTIALVTLMPLFCYMLRIKPELASWVVDWVASAALLLVGTAALAEGMRERWLMKLNAGMLQIALLAAIKFADSGLDILTRAVIFIVIGIAFIAANVYMSRKFRDEKASVPADGEVCGDVEK